MHLARQFAPLQCTGSRQLKDVRVCLMHIPTLQQTHTALSSQGSPLPPPPPPPPPLSSDATCKTQGLGHLVMPRVLSSSALAQSCCCTYSQFPGNSFQGSVHYRLQKANLLRVRGDGDIRSTCSAGHRDWACPGSVAVHGTVMSSSSEGPKKHTVMASSSY